MTKAFHRGDYDTFLDYNHPKIVQSVGGREKMKTMLKNGFGPGVKLTNVSLKKAEKIYCKGKIYQCSMEQRQELMIDGTKVYTIGSMIAISYDAGKTWSYIGVANNTLEKMRQFFPELDTRLPVKPQMAPIVMN